MGRFSKLLKILLEVQERKSSSSAQLGVTLLLYPYRGFFFYFAVIQIYFAIAFFHNTFSTSHFTALGFPDDLPCRYYPGLTLFSKSVKNRWVLWQ